jgi:hypothetical protein
MTVPDRALRGIGFCQVSDFQDAAAFVYVFSQLVFNQKNDSSTNYVSVVFVSVRSSYNIRHGGVFKNRKNSHKKIADSVLVVQFGTGKLAGKV